MFNTCLVFFETVSGSELKTFLNLQKKRSFYGIMRNGYTTRAEIILKENNRTYLALVQIINIVLEFILFFILNAHFTYLLTL